MNLSTREQALLSAMNLLAGHGADHVTMEAVAEGVGIRAPSLYKHFKNRAELMEELENRLKTADLERFQALSAQLNQLARDLKALGILTPQRFDQEALSLLEPRLLEPSARAYRQLLLQGCGAGGAGIGAYYDVVLLRYVAALERFFDDLAGLNIFRKGESRVMAMELISPLSHLVFQADGKAMLGQDFGGIQEDIQRHLKQFHRVYAVREKPAEKPAAAPPFPSLSTGGKRLFRGNR